MKCPDCGSDHTHALNARTVRNYKRRTRECQTCRHAWTTHEINLDAATMKLLHPNSVKAYRVGQYFATLWGASGDALHDFLRGWESVEE